MDQFYEKPDSLFVEAYDAFYSSSGLQIAGDLAFYQRIAREVGGPVLETRLWHWAHCLAPRQSGIARYGRRPIGSDADDSAT